MEKMGLTTKEVQDRIDKGLINKSVSNKTKSYGTIISTNVFTLFNFLNFSLALAIIFVGSYKNLLFMGVVFCNTIIGIIQEIQAKKTIDKLSIIAKNQIQAYRNNELTLIDVDQIVQDDILEFSIGDQIVVDSIILNGDCEVDESLLTGESSYIYKKANDKVLSGSFVMSGKIFVKVQNVGENNYTSKILKGISYVRDNNSQIIKSLKKIIKYLSFIIVPLGIILFYRQISIENNLTEAVIATVAALLGMIPEGLILLTSTVLMVGVIRLANHQVLVQELYCIESLARVDTLCLDKTGTLTEGNMKVVDVVPIGGINQNKIEEIMGNILNASIDNNATIQGLKKHYKLQENYKLIKNIPFSSLNKYSGAIFEEGEYLIGATDFLLKNNFNVETKLKKYEKFRVIALVKKDNPNIPLALIILDDVIRKSAKKTIQYFYDQGIDIKIISGDSAESVSNVALRLGIENSDKITNYDKNIKNIIDYTIIGRVSPEEKRQLIQDMKKSGKTVAMIGDGINDVGALKEADCSLAMSTGASSARNVSQIVLLDSTFDAVPKILLEGRRSINNLERSATLFLVKTIYTFLLVIAVLFLNYQYPFIPIQLSLTNIFTIGIPSFVLALERNDEKVTGRFLLNILRTSFPVALSIVVSLIMVSITSHSLNLTDEITSTLSVVIVGFSGLMLLFKISYPLNILRWIVFISMTVLFFVGFIGLRELLDLYFVKYMIFIIPLLMFLNFIIFRLFTLTFDILLEKIIKKRNSYS